MKFNENLKALREDSDLTQTQLGKLLNMTQRKVSYLETGNTEPTTQEIIKICKFFKLSSDYMLGLTNEPKPLPKK